MQKLPVSSCWACVTVLRYFLYGGGKEALKVHGKTPLWMFEVGLWRKYQLRDEEKEAIIALLGGL
jgi:hypothetical protein